MLSEGPVWVDPIKLWPPGPDLNNTVSTVGQKTFYTYIYIYCICMYNVNECQHSQQNNKSLFFF